MTPAATLRARAAVKPSWRDRLVALQKDIDDYTWDGCRAKRDAAKRELAAIKSRYYRRHGTIQGMGGV